MRNVLLAGLAVAAGLSLISNTARAERYVVVNGERMNLVQISQLEQIACAPIPNGVYWLNTMNGAWGYAGDPRPRGNIRDGCNRQAYRPGLSERGLLYSPHDWVR